MDESQFGSKVRQVLNQGLGVSLTTAESLNKARELALSRQRRRPAPALALRLLLPIATVLIGVAGIYSWQLEQRNADLEEIDAQLDAQLLTDKLPIDAYLDSGFQNWLGKRVGEE